MNGIASRRRHKVFARESPVAHGKRTPPGKHYCTHSKQHTHRRPMKAITLLAALACVLEVSHEFPFNFNKRSLDSLARTGQLPEFKRSLASLAKSGQLPERLVQEKRMLDELEQANDANSRAIHEQRSRVVEEIKSLARSGANNDKRQDAVVQVDPSDPREIDFRDEFKADLREILDQYLKKFGTTFDQEKVELFLTNMADEVFDNHGVVSLDHIRFLIETGYFQPEMRDEDDVKPAGGESSPEDYISKRFMASLARTGNMPYWRNGPRYVAKRYISSLLRQGRLPYGFQPTTEPSSMMAKHPDWNMQQQKPKRGAGAEGTYQNDEEFIPVMQGSRSLQSIIDDLTRDPEQKRYLGALSRSGWMPRGFASSSSSHPSSAAAAAAALMSSSRAPLSYRSTGVAAATAANSGYGKRHLAALARLGLLPSFRNPHSFYMRNGRGSSFQCDIDKRTSTTVVTAVDGNVENIGRPSEELGDVGSPAATEPAQADGLKAKRYLLLPAVDNILLRRQYPHLATNKI